MEPFVEKIFGNACVKCAVMFARCQKCHVCGERIAKHNGIKQSDAVECKNNRDVPCHNRINGDNYKKPMENVERKKQEKKDV